MNFQKTKKFKDNVHGYIEVPVDYVTLFIDTDIFQRLRNIEQTGMRVLYSSARHDRFIHSLGTYYLGSKAFSYFKKNVEQSYSQKRENKPNLYYVFEDNEKNEKFWEKCRILFEIACLLHDCGHSPFSHTLEFHYEKTHVREQDNESLKNKLIEFLPLPEFKRDFNLQGTPHERMSALVMCSEFGDSIDELIKKYELQDVDDTSNKEFVARMIIGCKYSNESKFNQLKNCFIELLNSNSIDVDSLDYIIRDSKMSGIDNMAVDVERLLGSLTLVEITEFNNAHFRDVTIDTNIIDGHLVPIQSHIDGKVCTIKAKLQGTFKMVNSSGNMSGFLDFESNMKVLNEPKIISSEGYVLINGSKGSSFRQTSNSNNVIAYGSLDQNLEYKESTYLNAQTDMNIVGNLQCQSCDFSSTFVKGTINGIFTGKLLGSASQFPTSLKPITKFQLGFHKSSLSVIQNVIIARNFEYQWIYTHHKVVYSANYLIIELLRKSIKYLLSKEAKLELNPDDVISSVFSWKRMISDSEFPKIYSAFGMNFLRPTDADIMCIFKKAYTQLIENKEFDNETFKLLNEYYSRRYRKSLWKSYAEFNIFFADFSIEQKNEILDLIQKNSVNGISNKYGYFQDDWEQMFKENGMSNVVWVNGDSKLKSLNPDKTYILFKNSVFSYRTISSKNDIKTVGPLNLFYIYYEPIDKSTVIKTENILSFIRSKLFEK